MPARAFVIVIEDYGEGNFLPSLPGGNADAATFVKWLIDQKGVARDSIICCANKKFKWRTTGTTAGNIINALAKVMKDWADQTDEFYFYFWGHGFSYSTSAWEKSVDVLVASDFTSLETGGRYCLKLNEIKTKLWKSLGPKHHYYFIDACRNVIAEDKIAPAETGLGFPTSQLGTPTVYKIFSTAQGSVAKTASGFTHALVRGLSGGGRAKGLRNNRMYVVFDLLSEYMRRTLQGNGQDVDYDREGSGEGHILELNPIPKSKCEINVEDAKPDDKFTLTVADIKGFGKEYKFKGDSYKVALFPDDYSLTITHPAAKVVQTEPPPSAEPLDLYDSCVVNFVMHGKAGAKKPASKNGGRQAAVKASAAATGEEGIAPEERTMGASLQLKATAAPHTEIQVKDLKTGNVVSTDTDFLADVRPGEYMLRLRERGVTVSNRKVTIKPGEKKKIDLLRRPKSKIKETALKAVKANLGGGLPVFSERYLGPMANDDLGLWLSLFGASRILGVPGDFRKLEKLQLETFTDMKKDEAAVYVLAGFEKSNGEFHVGLSEGPQVEWEMLREVKDLYKIYERRLPATAGPQLLSINIPKQLPLTFSIHCMPNRVTFVTLAEEKDGRLRVHQFLLPVRHLFPHLRPKLGKYPVEKMLSYVRTAYLAQIRFARKLPVENLIKETDMTVWRDLMNLKWLDPFMPLLLAFDVVRHGTANQEQMLLDIINSNLRKHFEGMPDVEAIAKLLGAPWKVPDAAPLSLDGVLAFDDVGEKQILPLPPDKLDYSSQWTLWRGAVNAPEATRK